jgi:hypothetical protein
MGVALIDCAALVWNAHANPSCETFSGVICVNGL